MNRDSGNSHNAEDLLRSSARHSNWAHCPVCRVQTDLISFDKAAEQFHTDRQDIDFLAKRGDLHQIHNRKGKIMICKKSLFDCFESRQTRLLDTGIIKKIEMSA